MEAVAPERLAKGLKADRGVSCEACHGPAGAWLRFHTRPDVTYRQIVAAGLRDLNDLYGRANACVACHLNLDESIRRVGHPELFFEFAAQSLAQPPHYTDERPSLGPRSWLTGQAVALRELSWKLAAKQDDRLLARWKALVWLLRKTEPGRKELPETGEPSAMQSAADRLARNASAARWTREDLVTLLKNYLAAHAEFADAKTDSVALRRRAEVLVPSVDRLWVALKKEGRSEPGVFEPVLDQAVTLARAQEDFEPAKFAAVLQELEKAFERAWKP
jgi:hypothetical protein